MTSSSCWIVNPESHDEICLPNIEAWNASHSLIYAPSGDINAVDSEWIGFFINREVAERVKTLLDSNRNT